MFTHAINCICPICQIKLFLYKWIYIFVCIDFLQHTHTVCCTCSFLWLPLVAIVGLSRLVFGCVPLNKNWNRADHILQTYIIYFLYVSTFLLSPLILIKALLGALINTNWLVLNSNANFSWLWAPSSRLPLFSL